MELEYETVTIPITENFQNEINALVKDRWEIQPGTKPVAVYHLVRVKQVAGQQDVAGIGGFGDLKIDDSKIHHIRGGRIVNPDGTVKDEAESKRILSGDVG